MEGGFMSMSGWEGDEGGNDDVTTAAVVAAHVATLLEWRRRARLAVRVQRPRYRGSTPGRVPNKPRNFELGLHCILRDYFGVDGLPPVYNMLDFERRFRVPMAVFQRIYHAIKDRPFWVQRVNATGRPQAHPLQKLVAVFRVLGYGESCDRADEYVRLSSSTISRAVTLFTEFMVDEFSSRYLRPPTRAEIGNILGRNAERGLPGCLGSLDCSHWQWSACPKGRAGTYQGRNGQRSIVIEAICDEDTWIYHIFAGSPGSLNDINVLYQSPLYMDVITGKWPPRDFPFTVNGNTRTLLYYLVDGIYPRFAFFVAPYPNPQTREQRTFNRLQEALRKDVERLFGILTARFHIMLHPCRYWSVPRMVLTTQTVAILHNMVVEARRDGFVSRSRSSWYGGGGDGPGAAGPAGNVGPAVGTAAGGAGAGVGVGAGAGAGAGAAGAAAGEAAEHGAGGVAPGAGAPAAVGAGGDAPGAGDGAEAGAGAGAGSDGVAGAGASAGDGADGAGDAAAGDGGGGTGAGGGEGGTGAAAGAAGSGGACPGAGNGGGADGAAAGDGVEDGGADGDGAQGLDDLEHTPGVPPPHVGAAAVAPMSEFMRILMATGEAKSLAEHQALRDDLCAHVFAQRGELLEPYVD